jgi:serine/threonine protein kinase/Tol biopolymer transport system component
MPLTPGTKFGPYEIQSPLGAGGMGEVYRARDTRLDRSVAIKILPEHFCADPIRRQRFDREAKTISNLNHPNICVVHDVGHQDGIDYIVMECVEGETLARRLEKGPLPVEQVLKYGAQIADALDKAHRSGVVHRDLKPGNIMLTPNGAKLLDFGLAKPASPLATGSTLTAHQPSPATAQGTIVGTFQYMSPEQVEGMELDGRSDIFSFGAVLYEMLTGKRAFEGSTTASVIAAVLERNPQAISTMQPASPPALDRIVKICLAKNPDDRWRAASDIKLQLEGLRDDLQAPALPDAAPRAKGRERAFWIAAILLAAVAALLAGIQFRKAAPEIPSVRSSLLPPPNWSFLVSDAAISPDGQRVAFVAVGPNGQTSLWVRSLATGADQQLPKTDGATLPFWSPDSMRLGFFAESKLKIMDANGAGIPKILAEATFGRGGSWNRDGTIVYAPDLFGILYRIPDAGGSPQAVTKLSRPDSPQAHRWPFFLPDGKHFLFSTDWSSPGEVPGNGIYVGSLEGGDSKPLITEFTSNAEFASGKLLYVRDLTLMSQPFDSEHLKFTGVAVPVWGQQVVTNDSFSISAFSVSQTGMLIFQSVADLASQLDWFSSKGEQIGQLPIKSPLDPRISPDGKFIAFALDEAENGKRYLHLYDTSRDIATRVTDAGGEEAPTWSPDGKKLAFISGANASYALYQVTVGSNDPPEQLWKGARARQPDYGRDAILFGEFSRGRPRIMAYSLADHQSSSLNPGAEPRLSPDGHWLIYTFSSGHPFRPDVYLEPYPGPGGRVQISRNGGAQGTWSHDGKKIYFISPDKKLMMVNFDPAHKSVSAPEVLFQTRIIAPSFVTRQYDVAPDGRFLVNSLPPGSAPPLTLLTNWPGQKN